jgi:hypothetical protein
VLSRDGEARSGKGRAAGHAVREQLKRWGQSSNPAQKPVKSGMPFACFALISIQLVNGIDTDEIISNRHFAKARGIAGIGPVDWRMHIGGGRKCGKKQSSSFKLLSALKRLPCREAEKRALTRPCRRQMGLSRASGGSGSRAAYRPELSR